MYMNERKSGTNHVTAALAAEANAAPMGRVSVVFEYKDMFKLNCTPTTGDIYVSSGALIWNGRHCGVVNTENVKYTPPESDTLYKQIIVAAQYRKDASSGVETVSLVALESEIVESQSAAMNLTMNTGSAEIGEATTLANFPLWRFVVTATTHTEPVQLFDVQKSYKTLEEEIADNANELQQEKDAREALENTVNKIQKGLVTLSTNVSGGVYENTSLKLSDFIAFMIVFSTGETMLLPAAPGTSYYQKFYKFEGEGTITSPTKVTVGSREIKVANFDYVKIMQGTATNGSICGSLQKIYGIR